MKSLDHIRLHAPGPWISIFDPLREWSSRDVPGDETAPWFLSGTVETPLPQDSMADDDDDEDDDDWDDEDYDDDDNDEEDFEDEETDEYWDDEEEYEADDDEEEEPDY